MQKRARGRAGRSVSYLFAAALVLAMSGPLAAEMVAIQIDAESGGEVASYTWVVPKALDANGHMDWSMLSPMTLSGPKGTIATVDQLTLGFDGDPGVSLQFSVAAGVSTTNFTITSAVVNFAAINNPAAYASAGITLTDVDSDGATLTGQLAGGKSYEAIYNGGTAWADLVNGIVASPDTTVVSSERQPGAGRQLILAALTSIQSQFKFSVTPNDMASGTSRFDVQEAIPEPGTLFLLGTGIIGGLGYWRRRSLR